MRNNNKYSKTTSKGMVLLGILVPAAYIALLIIVAYLATPFSIFSPQTANSANELRGAYHNNNLYVNTSSDKLYYTGYSEKFLGHTYGYYYYGLLDDECVFYLISPSQSNNASATLEDVNITAKLLASNDRFFNITSALSKDLGWTQQDMQDNVFPYLVSQSDCHIKLTVFMLAFFCISAIFALVVILINIVKIRKKLYWIA